MEMRTSFPCDISSEAKSSLIVSYTFTFKVLYLGIIFMGTTTCANFHY